MEKDRGFEFLEHISDAKFRAYGKTLEECFNNAGRAFFALMVNIDEIKPDLEIQTHIEAENLEWLLFDWLNELLYLFESEGLIFSSFDVSIEEKEDLYILDATCYGTKIDPTTEIDLYVKAITLHDLVVRRGPDEVSVEVVVDV
ncbi:MAG: archease [Candidatus Syntrophoarchaeum sp. WYZ-LMO15]|nr:MAG: archease [Candidatus Syntrophoarchaeum sp. WYZ-LMO15]